MSGVSLGGMAFGLRALPQEIVAQSKVMATALRMERSRARSRRRVRGSMMDALALRLDSTKHAPAKGRRLRNSSAGGWTVLFKGQAAYRAWRRGLFMDSAGELPAVFRIG